MIHFGQGAAYLSKNGGSLKTSSHITCYNVTLLNLENHESAMFHVWEGGYNGLSSQQKEVLKEFLQPYGKKVAIIVEGERSSPSHYLQDLLIKAGVDVLDIIYLKSGNMRWNACFDPSSCELYIDDENGKVLYQGVPFPKHEKVLSAERKIPDTQKRARQLDPYVSLAGELSKDALHQLKISMDRPPLFEEGESVYSTLLQIFVKARAHAAGFQDYCDYFDADDNNFTNIDPQSLELVLRKLSNPEDSLKNRFKAAGLDLDEVYITPEVVVTLLKDYPATFENFVQSLS